ncbi:MAG TPA: GNAT family N-acetyltransferase [Deinococcales bacterium]|nr:GNAT family N-acetyltransferase [Deinococcales bacterium]
MIVRPYRSDDEAACLAAFDGNSPYFFADWERGDFAAFLRAGPSEPYFVVEDGGRVVACGGVFARSGGRTAGLSWGMVERSRQRRGYGRALLRARLDWLREHLPGLEAVTIETSQRSEPFFARMGFEVTRVEPDHWAPGLDRVDMRLALGPTG